MTRLPVVAPLVCLLALSVSWHPAVGEGGCEQVFAATSRGGSVGPPNGGGCNPFSGSGAGVIRVVDGDTIVLSGGDRVRYVGIDTPEVGGEPEYYGREALEFNRGLVEGRKVTLQRDASDRDRFGRLLRFVYADGILVNAELVREGFARARVYPPDTRYSECFAALEQEARESRRGLWARDSGASR